MGLEKVILKGNQVILTEVTPFGKNVSLYGSNYLYGEINKVSDICDNYKEGDIVIYSAEGATLIVVEDSPYSVITEDKIQIKELP